MTNWTALATDLAAGFAERAAEVDRTGRFPVENLDRLRATGYLTIAVPAEFGFAFTVASIYLGVARAAVRFAYDYVTNRTVTGASLPMARQSAQVFNAGRIELLRRPAEALVSDGLRRREAGEVLAPADLNAIKYVVVNAADEAVDQCVRMVGGHGIFRKLPLVLPRCAGGPFPPAEQRRGAGDDRQERARHRSARRTPLG